MKFIQRANGRLFQGGSRARLSVHWDRLERQARRISEVERVSRTAAKEAELHVREMNRVAPQLAALESKVETLRQALEAGPRVDEVDDLRQARNIVDEVRREHERIRIRLSAVTTYEERLRRIEEKLDLPHD